MPKDDSSWQTRAALPNQKDIFAARAQVEAARLRQQHSAQRRAGTAADGIQKALPGYTLQRELHRGGQGVVYLAVQESTDRQVAIKLLRSWPAAGSLGLARFEREVDILSRLKHRNIVTIHDCGRHEDAIYLVMDYVAGRPLDAFVERTHAPLRDTLRLFASVCDGVNAAHLHGVIHRDLKPGNILVDAHGEPHVLDFGLAKLADDSAGAALGATMTATGQFVGSLPWASPEQADGRCAQLDVRTDVYSLGVVFYQLLTRRFPYPVSGRLDEVVRHIAQTDPVRPSSIERKVDRELETILLKCLAKAPERRYQNAGELARDIRRYLAGAPIEARRDSLAYVMSKRLARYRAVALTAAVILLVVSAALAASVRFWRQAEDQRILALQNAGVAEKAARRADEEAQQAQAVTAFMREVLTSVDPDVQGADVRLTQVLARASETAAQRFATKPQQEAAVRDLLGNVLTKLSLWPEAQWEFARAQQLWRDSAGPDDPRALSSASCYAGVSLNLEQPGVAEAVLQDLLPRLERVLGPDHPMTAGALRDLAVLRLQQGRADEAEQLLHAARAHPALQTDDTAQIRILAGLIGLVEHRLTGASAAERDALLAQAAEFADEWHVRAVRLESADSSLALHAQWKQAEIACARGDCVGARTLCRQILERPAGRLGSAHWIRVGAMFTLARALGRLGEDAEAADLHLRRIELLRQQYSTDDPVFVGQLGEAITYLGPGGRPVEGEALARELAGALRAFGGGHGDILFDAELHVARFVSEQNRLAEAERMFAPLLAQQEQLRDECTRARLHLFYGCHLARRGFYVEAEEQLQAAVAWAGDIRLGTWDSHPDDVILGFIELYKAWGDSAKLAEYRRLRAELLSPECPADFSQR